MNLAPQTAPQPPTHINMQALHRTPHLDDVLLPGVDRVLEGLEAGAGRQVGVHQQEVVLDVEDATELFHDLK